MARSTVDDSACAATWDSAIGGLGGKDDGQIEVKVDSSGKVTGTHKKSNKPIDGQCTPGRPHLIHFTREENGCQYTYDGVIGLVPGLPSLPAVPSFAVIVGKVHTAGTCLHVLDDDDWVGTHTT